MQPRAAAGVAAEAGGRARQVNIGGDNYGPIQLVGTTAPKRVRQLPFAAPDFSGRVAEIERIAGWVAGDPSPRVVNIYGIPGSGKSALAVQVAHRLSDDYPDCQLHFNFRSAGQQPVSADDLLGGALVALGVPPAEVPTGLALRSASYRSALDGRRSIIIVDNASSAAQVEPVLPGWSEAVVLITSWTPIPELPGVRTLPLRTLTEDEAVAMLAAVARREIPDADNHVVRQIARLAGDLPLALRIAGGMLKSRPHWTWSDLVRRLGDPRDPARLDKLASGQLAVKASFDLAYGELSPATAQGYRLLGLAPSPRVSAALARVLIAEDADRAEEIFDQLVGCEFLQPETEDTFRMHDLLWLRAQELVNSMEEPGLRQATVDRMTAWSLARLDTHYLPRLQFQLNLLPALASTRPRPAATPAEVYVDSPVVADDPAGWTGRLTDAFPARRRAVLTAPGGTGKTTMANYLCHQAARRRTRDRTGPIPFSVLLRDLRPEDEGDLAALILRTLAHRYEVDLTPEALRVALRSGQVCLVLDGLDEVIDSTRQVLVASIVTFAEDHPRVPILVTTRPYSTVHSDLPGFARLAIAPWTWELAGQYLSKLGEAHLYRLHEYRASPVVATPLGVQMLLSTIYRDDEVPPTFTLLMEEIVKKTVFSREYIRGTLAPSFDELRAALERIAYTMQSSTENRVAISRDQIAVVAAQITQLRHGTASSRRMELFTSILSGRVIVLQEIEENLFAFTHTAFREHLAASHVARMSAGEIVAVVEQHLADASWEAVFVAALELARAWRGEEVPNEVIEEADRRGETQVADVIRSWC